MQRPIYLSLVFHNHQPVGNFDFVFEEGYSKAYLPLVECLERHPKVHVGMHFSGCLRDWLQVHQPDLFVKLKSLVKRGQVEILTGAYYEPILTNLSDPDKIGQIRKLTTAIEKDFEYRPEGMWVAERVWEPHLVKPIAQTGVKYVIVDDTHFEYVGFKTDELLGYFVSEEQGYPLNIFPTLTRLRYIIPWAEVDKVIEWLRQQAQAQQPEYHYPKLAFMGDDGEKFGLWPGTYEQCWGNSRYMDRLFQAFEANSDWLITVSPREYMNKYPARGRAYLPTASYMEMSEWALPSDDSWELTSLRHRLEQRRDHEANPAQREEVSRQLRYLRGGFWRNFLVKYPEINHIQKRALWLSEQVHSLPEGQRKTEALEHLWAAQCNCAYWHGVFGGIYLFHIRAANYANLIAAEELVEEGQKLTLRKLDFDLDGNDEIMITGSPFSLIFDLSRGGSLLEWDYRPARTNLLNIMTRHHEGYHRQLAEAARVNKVITPDMPEWNNLTNIHDIAVRAKQKGLENYLVQDWYRRGAFIDHFWGEATTLEGFYRSQYPEEGDFVSLPYQATWKNDDQRITLTLSRDGHVWVRGEHLPVRVEKNFVLKTDEPILRVNYRITNQAATSMDLRFGVETALGYVHGDGEQCYLQVANQRYSLGGVNELKKVTSYSATTHLQGFSTRIDLDRPATLWLFSLEPVTTSEGGFERMYQGTVFLQWWSFTLQPGQTWDVRLNLTVENL